MTEQMAIEIVNDFDERGYPTYRKAKNMAIQALTEIQQYRAIGTVEELRTLKDSDIPIIHGKAELEYHDREIRNKAIEEFAEKCNQKITEFILEHKEQLTFVSGVSVAWIIIDEIAESMKGEMITHTTLMQMKS